MAGSKYSVEFDLSTLNLSAGTHEITVKARASGYADSPASNAVSYVVESDTVQVSGTWYFNETITDIPPDQNVTFVSKATIFDSINTPDKKNIQYSTTIAYSVGAWTNEAYRTITFDGTQTVSKEFYEWLTANAENTNAKTRPLSGTWKFNATPSFISSTDYSENIDFISNGVSFEELYVTHKGYYIRCMPTNGEKGDELYIYDRDTGWLNSAYRTIAFVGTQYVSHAFYDWLVANAVRQSITFTIDGTSYTALSGMTWGEWVESEYNTGGFTLNTSFVNFVNSNGDMTNYFVADENKTLVWETEQITAGHSYIKYYVSGALPT